MIEAVSLERLAASGQRLSHYRFHHSLIQRNAYVSLDAVERVRLHEATGKALESIYAGEGERPLSLSSIMARHFESAGMRLAAARALHDAGRQAMWLSAFRQALQLFDHGLALLADEQPSAECKEIHRLLEAARLVPQLTVGGPGGVGVADSLERISHETEADGETEAETDGLTELDGEAEADGLVDGDGETEGETLTEIEGESLGETELDGETEADGLVDGDSLAQSLTG